MSRLPTGRACSLLLAGGAVTLACGGENLVEPETTTGKIIVTSATIGTASDADGYTITLDGTDRESLGENAAATLDGLPPGAYAIGLGGLAAVCQTESENPQTVDVPLGGTVTAEFRVVCLNRSTWWSR